MAGLDRWNRVEAACEIGFSAHLIFAHVTVSQGISPVGIETSRPSGQCSLCRHGRLRPRLVGYFGITV